MKQQWTSGNTRKAFFQFFENKGHAIVSSAPMVLKNDPTLMFTNAGMNQFKDVFLGNKKPQSTRIADTQKCLRVSGKHNDLEEVGVDTYHHTMFEMLGNWSFGDYFKEEAIEWAWELLTDVYAIDKDRLYVTVFEGDPSDDLGMDQEAYDFWKNRIDEARILKGNKKDNFWEMGEVGPCGPSSEIHVDIRSDEERKKVDGKTLVNRDHPEVIEIWNLVFIQYNRLSNGTLQPLPQKHVDTGMGLERLCMVLQGKQSNYETDVFQAIIRSIEAISGKKYGKDEQIDIALRVVADHLRAVAFSIADGQLPSNTGAGYVIRRILRRATRYGYSFLEQRKPFIYALVKILEEQMGDQFPELRQQKVLIEKVIREEEENFLRTLERGILRFEEWVGSNEAEIIDGKFAFELYDTYGFPVDLTQLLAREKDRSVDMEGFRKELQKQKDRSRKATKVDAEDWVVLKEDDKEEFIGYDYLETDVEITRYRKIKVKEKEKYQLVFNFTPFYAESGGQVGDKGYIEADGKRTYIQDTKKEHDLIIHLADQLPDDVHRKFRAVVDHEKRKHTANNHTGTHLLHHALRAVLGNHVEQKGSLVHPDYLRFDFSHFSKLEEGELLAVERMVNEKIRENIALNEKRAVPMKEAKEMGAMALFGEKYGDVVRVIQFGDSVELCGGTHVKATGEIGTFKIVSESAIAAGVRRIEAITADKAEEYIQKRLDELEAIKQLLKSDKNVRKTIQQLMDKNAELTKKLEALNKEKALQVKDVLLREAEEINGVKFIGKKVPLDPRSIKDLSFQLKQQEEKLLLVLGAEVKGKANLTVAISDALVKEKELNAGNIIKDIAKEIQGGGGGQPFFATAGGRNIDGIAAAINKAKTYLQ